MENSITEEQLQARCFRWFDESFPAERKMLFAVPNGGLRDRHTANVLKATGVQPGVSDMIFVTDEVTFIEMKIPGGVQSDEQKKFMERVRERGHDYRIIYSFEEFQKLIKTKIARYERQKTD